MRRLRILERWAELRELEQQLALVLLDTGLTLSQFRLLIAIAESAPVKAIQLSLQLGITKASITTQLRELEKAKLILVEPNPGDGRSVLASLSGIGKKRLDVTLDNIAVVEKHLSAKRSRTASKVENVRLSR